MCDNPQGSIVSHDDKLRERAREYAQGLFNALSKDRYLTDKELTMIADQMIAFAAAASAGESVGDGYKPVLWAVKHNGMFVGNLRLSQNAATELKRGLDANYPDGERAVVTLYEKTPAPPLKAAEGGG